MLPGKRILADVMGGSLVLCVRVFFVAFHERSDWDLRSVQLSSRLGLCYVLRAIAQCVVWCAFIVVDDGNM